MFRGFAMIRWCAPEVLGGEEKTASKEADVYSFAMVMVEAFSGQVPFRDSQAYEVVMLVAAGTRPPRPDHPALADHLWELIQRCWNADPKSRPQALEVKNTLNLGSETFTPYYRPDASSSGCRGSPRLTDSAPSSPQSTNPPWDRSAQSEVFLDLEGNPLVIYVDEDTRNRSSIVDLIKSHGGIISSNHGDVKFILVDPHHKSGQTLYRQHIGKKGKYVLDVQWVHRCIEAGSVQMYHANWAGCKVTGTGVVS